MDTIIVDKTKLIEIMKKNRDDHAAIVAEAQDGFRTKVISRLDEMLAMAKKGRKIDINVGLVMPVDMTEEYDTVIGMLELDTDEKVELQKHEYEQWVLDKWNWSRQATTTNAYYSMTAAAKL